MTRPDEPELLTIDPEVLFDRNPVEGGGKRLLLALLLVVGLVGLWRVASAPPTPLSLEARGTQASGERAREVLERLAGPDTPHPAGSAAARAVERRLEVALEDLGLQPQVQQVTLEHRGRTGRVRNVVAKIQGNRPELPAALVVTHYDSVAAGPGVGDDLAGVAAVLEAVRALREAGRPRRTLVLLFTEGEEENLGGAEAFAREHPLMAEVGCVLNFEGRGAGGVSRLFELGENSGGLVQAYARAARRPNGTSLAYEVYRRMPNDSDFTVFKRRGLPGLNFAFIGDLHAYHTPLDDLRRLDPRTLQHHTDQALAALWATQDPELDLGATSSVGFADLFGRALPVSSRWELRVKALLVLLAVLWGSMRLARNGVLRGRGFLMGLFAAPLAAALCGGAALGLQRGLDLATGTPDAAAGHPAWSWAGLLGLVVFLMAPLGDVLRRLGGTVGSAVGTWCVLALAGALSSLFLVGATTLFLLPAFLAGACLLVVRPFGDVRSRVGRITCWVLGATVVCWTPLVDGLMEAFHTRGSLISAGAMGLVAATSVPLWTAVPGRVRWGLASLGMLLCLGVFGALAVAHPRTPERPGRTNLVLTCDLDRKVTDVRAETYGEPHPALLAQLLEETHGPQQVVVPELELRDARVLPDGRRRLLVHLAGGGPRAELWIERGPGLLALTLDGVPVHGEFYGLGPEGLELELLFEPAAPDALAAEVAIGVQTVTPGLPEPLGPRLKEARGERLVPSGRGDRTLARRVLTLPLPLAGE